MNSTIFRDFVLLMVLGFVAMVVWMLPHINPPALTEATEPPGNLIVVITWPEGNTDVDMWVMGPGEVRPVGYSNSSGLLWNLLRDDLGTSPDVTPLNYENAYTRGVIPGEYIINVHCYRCSVVPVPVVVEVSMKTDNARPVVIAHTRVVLGMANEEQTALRFRLTKDGKVVPGSLNHVFAPLRGMK